MSQVDLAHFEILTVATCAQGKFVKRHRIPNTNGIPYKPQDLAVGATVTIYGRTFYIVAVDAHTRSHLEGLVINVAADEECPQSPYDLKHGAHSTGVDISIIAA